MQAPNDHLDALNPDGPSTSSQICAARELNSLQEELSSKTKRQTIPEKIKKRSCLLRMEIWNPRSSQVERKKIC